MNALTKASLHGAAGGVLLAALLAAAAQPTLAADSAVYYQVAFSDGTVKDLSAPPRTNQGITRVVRISRKSVGLKGYEVLSTHRGPLIIVNPDQVVREEMTWDGGRWVVPRPAPKAAAGPSAPPDARALAHVVRGLELRVGELTLAVGEAEKALAGAEGDAARAKAAADLDAARRQVQEARRLHAAYQSVLDRARPPAAAHAAQARDKAREIAALQASLGRLRARLRLFQAAVVEAEGGLFEDAGSPDAADARWELEALRKIRDELLRQVAAHEKRLGELTGSPQADAPPGGP